jgi:hypothetical protein
MRKLGSLNHAYLPQKNRYVPVSNQFWGCELDRLTFFRVNALRPCSLVFFGALIHCLE